MNTKRNAGLLIGFLLGGLFLYLAVRGVEWNDVGAVLRRAVIKDLLLACGWATAAIFLRAVRWRVLLKADHDLSIPVVFWATTIGYLGNHFLPARMGELMRTAAIAWKAGASKAYVLATALAERMLDGAILGLISAIALLTLDGLPAAFVRPTQAMAAVSTFGVAAIFLLPRCEALLQNCVSALRLGASIQDRFSKLLIHFMIGMRVFHDAGRTLQFLILTGTIWTIDGLAALSVSQSLGLDLSFAQLLLLIAALGLASALPSTPGFVGVYQFTAVSVLGPFGIARHDALAYIFLFQGVVSGCVLVWGLMGMWQLGINRRSAAPAPVLTKTAAAG